ncbi:MAG: response regulator [Gammaproteobacteria bacterium]|nr:response regulator [Gammaproteobacteria bacterium]
MQPLRANLLGVDIIHTTLAAPAPHAEQAKPDMQKKTPASKRRILIVDQDRTLVAALMELLNRSGYETASAHTVADAIAAVGLQEPDLALIDISLSDPDGQNLGSVLRSKFKGPVVVLSARDDSVSVQDAIRSGAVAYVVKGDYPQNYLPAIEVAVARSAERQAMRQREDQLSSALQQTRTISTATGVLMERAGLNRQEAFERLRGLARAHRIRLKEVAERVLASVECLNGNINADARESGETIEP